MDQNKQHQRCLTGLSMCRLFTGNPEAHGRPSANSRSVRRGRVDVRRVCPQKELEGGVSSTVELSSFFSVYFFKRLFSNLDGKHQSYKINARFDNDTMGT